MIVLDTNVLSELMRPAPEPAVLDWFAAQSTPALFVTAMTQAEILFGLELLPKGRRRTTLVAAANEMFEHDFAGRVLAFDSMAAVVYARIAATRGAAGRTIGQMDAQIASIALSHGATLATRNLPDFGDCDLELIDPWKAD